MSGSGYRNFLRLLEKWPLDPAKEGKDLGQALRVLFSSQFPQGSASLVNEKLINRQIYATRLLVEDHYKKKYATNSDTTFTGLAQEELKMVTSTAFMKEMTEESKIKPTFLDRIKNMKLL